MASLPQNLLAVTAKLVDRYGSKTVKLVQRNPAGSTFDPVTGRYTASTFTTTTPVKAVILPVKKGDDEDYSFTDGGSVLSNMRKLVLDTTIITNLKPGDTFEFLSSSWIVREFTTFNVDGVTDIAHIAYVERSGGVTT